MQTKFHTLIPLLLFSAVAGANTQNGLGQNITVTVFTGQAYPIQQQQLADHVYHLDSVENLEESFLTNLSTNPAQAEQQVRQVMHTAEWKQFETKLKTAYQGVIAGWKQGIMKIPAVLFESQDETAVIYGETNIANAIERYKLDLRQRGKWE